MGYDLYFYVKSEDKPVKKGFIGLLAGKNDSGDRQINDEELLTCLTSFGNFPGPERTGDGFDAGYLNRGTQMSIGSGTHIVFHLHRDEIKGREEQISFPGFKYTGLSAFMNLVRPVYFGHESAPIIKGICEKFGLYVSDPQDWIIGGDGKPKPFRAEDLIRCWEATNARIGKNMIAKDKANGGNVTYLVGPNLGLSLAKEKSLTWWKYKRLMGDIDEYRENNELYDYVPDLRLFKRKDGHTVLLGMAFMEDVGYLIPPCDLFYVIRNRQSEKGFVDANVLLTALGEYLESWQYGGIDFKVLSIDNASKAIDVVRKVKLDPIENYEGVTPGSFADFE